jgi:ribosomal protein L11 methyltransferase
MTTTLVTALALERVAVRLADALMEGEHHLPVTAAGAFEQEPPNWRFEAWFETTPDLSDLLVTARALIGAEADALAFDVKVIDEKDWVAKSLEDLPPVRAGRFVVHGAHDRHKLRENEIGLEIEASMAFGTGHHGTTLGCLLALDAWVARERVTMRRGPRRLGERVTIVDVGTGTGVLALAVAKALGRRGVAGDIDPEAVRIARENARLAGVASRVAIVPAAGLAHPALRAAVPAPLVVANILANPLVALSRDLSRAVAPGGLLVLSGLLRWQARRVEAAYRAHGLVISRRRLIGDWAALELRRPPRRPSA